MINLERQKENFKNHIAKLPGFGLSIAVILL